MTQPVSRRNFVAATAAAAAGAGLAVGRKSAAASDDMPALLGGQPVCKAKKWPTWPKSDRLEEEGLMDVLHSGKWFRGGAPKVDKFEETYSRLIGTKHCVATSSGTTALVAALGAMGIGPGDEVIVTPYTFIASVTSIMMHHALPVFVDVDRETSQIDPAKIEAAITDRTAAIMPVHIGGNACDLDRVMAVAQKHNLPVIEDACQAHLGEWRGRKVGSLGTAGCFSFQATKNLCSGEGGAIVTNDGDLAERAYAFQNNGRARKVDSFNFVYFNTRAANFRLTEFQGAILLAQLTRLEQHARRRDENAKYLSSMFAEIPGIAPAKMYDGCTRNAWHLYMFRYNPEEFAGMSRDKFFKALGTEGIPCSSGYQPVQWDAFVRESFGTRGAKRVFPKETLERWAECCRLPEYLKLCDEAVWFTQNVLLSPRSDMDRLAEAVRKVHKHAAALVKA